MLKKNAITRVINASLIAAVLPFSATQAASWQAGEWEISVGGNINAFYTITQCDAGDLGAGGGTMAGLACAGSNNNDAHGVSNGLLPASLNFNAKTQQNGYDIGATVNVYYGLATQDSNGLAGDALDFSTVDARQVFLTFGNENMGTIKAGRDFGLFGFDAIINDMTLLGTGATFAAANPGHTTLGGLGFGYVYTDRLSQINWTSNKSGGFQATLGVFNPVDGQESNGSATGNGGQPGFHGKLSYDWDGGYVSVSGLSQKVQLANGDGPSIQGMDIFGKIDIGNLGLAASYYTGEGMDTLGLGGIIFPGFDSTSGNSEEVNGYLLQGTYKLGDTKLGVNWAASEQEKINPVENDKLTLGLYHSLTKSLTLVGEVSRQTSENSTGEDETTSIAVGAMLFF